MKIKFLILVFNFSVTISLDKVKKVDIGENYQSPKAAKRFSVYIAQAEREQLKKSYEQSKFVSILSDGSTDISVIEQEITYCRFAVSGNIFCHFMSLESVDKPDAESIYKSICHASTKILGESWQSKLVSIATDGASVMTGKFNGVCKKVQDGRDFIVPVHCLAHRLELSIKDAFKSAVIHMKLETLLKPLYKFYHKSAVNRSGLKQHFRKLDLTCKVPRRIGGTRWVTHTKNAVDTMIEGQQAIVNHLNEVCMLNV